MKKIIRNILIVLVALAVLMVAGTLLYMNTGGYKWVADEGLKSTDTVTTSETSFGYFFDGPGSESALIFYPGGKVEATAYSELLKAVAENGTDCFLLEMPCDFAFLGMNKADRVLENYSYEKVYVGGHSLGGVVASMYGDEHRETVDGIILLASYSSVDISDSDMEVLMVYGSEDGVLGVQAMEDSMVNVPADTEVHCIDGGNHCQFGHYGFQKGDGVAKIDYEEQQKITVDYIKEFIN